MPLTLFTDVPSDLTSGSRSRSLKRDLRFLTEGSSRSASTRDSGTEYSCESPLSSKLSGLVGSGSEDAGGRDTSWTCVGNAGPEPRLMGEPGLEVCLTGEPGLEPLLTGEPGLEVCLTGKPGLEVCLTGEPGLEPLLTGEPGLEVCLTGEPGLELRLAGEVGPDLGGDLGTELRLPSVQSPTLLRLVSIQSGSGSRDCRPGLSGGSC